jgi:hypothetical protein
MTGRVRTIVALFAAIAAVAALPAVATAYTLIDYDVVIAIIAKETGLLLPSQKPDPCDRERISVPVTLGGDLRAHVPTGRPDGSFDYHIRPDDLTGSGPSGVDVRIVGAANGTAMPGEPFTIELLAVGSSDVGQIEAPTELTLVLSPRPDEGTAEARVVSIRIRDRCDPDDPDERAPSAAAAPDETPGGDGMLAAGLLGAGLGGIGVVAGAATRTRRRSR